MTWGDLRISCLIPMELRWLLPLPISIPVNFLEVRFARHRRIIYFHLIVFIDSSIYYTCSQGSHKCDFIAIPSHSLFSTDFQLKIYDMTSSPIPAHLGPGHIIDPQAGTMKVAKVIQGCPGSWTITDSHLSPDNKR